MSINFKLLSKMEEVEQKRYLDAQHLASALIEFQLYLKPRGYILIPPSHNG